MQINRFKWARQNIKRESLSQVSAETGLARSLLIELEADTDKPRGVSYQKIRELADYYGVSMDWLCSPEPLEIQTRRYRMNENEMIPNIPEHLWSAIADILRGSLWNIEAAPLQQPASRIEALISYCTWYYDRYGTPADLTELYHA